jgi:prepilin-type N-terminal cleavage/methylation domain-containing protein
MTGAGSRWLVFVVAVSFLPVLGLFTTHEIFFVRDLSFFFWSRHLWFRHALLGASAPWWDPYMGGGQPAIADALNQLLMPVTLAIRLLPSDVVSFNLWVALPLPTAGIGTFLFLRTRVRESAAALGACAFALSGPMVSMLNMPNLSWSVALMPWVMAAVGGREARGGNVIPIAIAFGLQGLCGELLTWAWTGALALTYGMLRSNRRRQVAAGLVAGALLAAVQLVPTTLAGVSAQRTALATPDFWSLHPVALWETLAPHLFGDFFTGTFATLPWMRALNFGRDPFFYSIYVGPLILLLALIGTLSRSGTGFWVGVLLLFLVAALGGYTPLYPALRRAVPVLVYFRFPLKYLVFSVFACAVLAADGWEAVRALRAKEAGDKGLPWVPGLAALAAVGLLLSLAAFLMPGAILWVTQWLAYSTHLENPAAGAAFLAHAAPPRAAIGFALLLAGCLVLAASGRRPQLVWLLFAAACADLAIASRGLNPVSDAGNFRPPAWYLGSAGPSRVYLGGRVHGFMDTNDPDGTPAPLAPPDLPDIAHRQQLNAQLPMASSGWGVREALSYDLPVLRSTDYAAARLAFDKSGPEARAAFLRRSGVSRCVLPVTTRPPYPVLAEVPDWGMRLFDCNPAATRVFVASAVEVAPDPADLGWQQSALFDATLPDDLARVPHMPPQAGRSSTPEALSARIVLDGATNVTVEAALPHSGLLVLRDSYDPSWRADVDGMPAEIVRANGLYRAVALPAGRHVIRFSYRPRNLVIGLIVSGTTVLLMISGTIWDSRGSRGSRGFTLIELMIVLAIVAILLSIAFNEYRGMQARANDTSAVASLRSIAAAQWEFALTCANTKYAAKLTSLAKPIPASGQAFLSPDLTSADTFEKSGYMFQMAATPLTDAPPACNGEPVAAGYAATADPVRPGQSGNYYYGVNADRVLYVDEEKTFTGSLQETGAAGHGAEVK